MTAQLAIVSNYAQPVTDKATEAFEDCIEGIKRVLTKLEKKTSAKSTMRTFDYIVRQVVVDGVDECSRVHAKTFEGETIWALIKIMAFAKSHEATVTALREIQTTYRGTLNAVGIH